MKEWKNEWIKEWRDGHQVLPTFFNSSKQKAVVIPIFPVSFSIHLTHFLLLQRTTAIKLALFTTIVLFSQLFFTAFYPPDKLREKKNEICGKLFQPLSPFSSPSPFRPFEIPVRSNETSQIGATPWLYETKKWRKKSWDCVYMLKWFDFITFWFGTDAVLVTKMQHSKWNSGSWNRNGFARENMEYPKCKVPTCHNAARNRWCRRCWRVFPRQCDLGASSEQWNSRSTTEWKRVKGKLEKCEESG